MIKTLQVPMVHMNGDRKETLIADLEAAYDAVNKAMDALRGTRPNGRNLYPLGPAAMKLAEDQHRARSLALNNVASELEEIMGGIMDGVTTVDIEVGE